MHKAVIDGISENVVSIVQLGKYGAIHAADPTTMGYYVIKYLSEPYTLQEYQTTDGWVSNTCELSAKYEYLSIMESKTNWYWKYNGKNQSIIILTRIIVHTYLYVSVIIIFEYITSIIHNKKQVLQAVQRQPIYIDDSYHDYNID